MPLLDSLRTVGATNPGVLRGLPGRPRAHRAANMRLFAADLRSTGELRGDLDHDTIADLV